MKKQVIVSLLMMILTLAPVLSAHAQTDTDDSQTQNDGKKGKKEKLEQETKGDNTISPHPPGP